MRRVQLRRRLCHPRETLASIPKEAGHTWFEDCNEAFRVVFRGTYDSVFKRNM